MEAYRAPWWLPGRHLQTIAGTVRVSPRVDWRRVRWTTPDRDFVHVDFGGAMDAEDVLVLFHGLESNSDAQQARALAAEAQAHGWAIAVPHFRGCSGEPNVLARAYHAGDADEIEWMLQRFAAERPWKVHAAGVSLGANVLLRWLGVGGARAARVVRRAVAVSAPFRLTATAVALERGIGLLYARRFLRHDLRRKALAKLQAFPGILDEERVRAAASLRQYDDAVTAPLHGFRDGYDYWTGASAEPWLARIRVPTLVLNARNDPFLPEQVLDDVERRRLPPEVALEFPRQGGHGGFPGRGRWLARRVLEFLSQP
jgi:predicted alpha/beta-fold hydrolase